MRLISTEFGQVLQLVVMEEIRPLQGIYVPEFYDAVANRYKFVTRPVDIPQARQFGAKFGLGKLELSNGGEPVQITELGIYNDGIIVVCRDTGPAEVAMMDFIAWATERFRLREPKTIHPRQYTSVVVVEFDAPVETAFTVARPVSGAFSKALAAHYGWKHDVNVTRFSMGIDPSLLPPNRAAVFAIERRGGVPHSASRWHCTAPLPTSEHLELLERFESAISD